jgi:hypothetical protein
MLPAMPILPRPVSPRSATADLVSMLRGPLPYKWPILMLSCALTAIIIYAFYLDAKPAPMEPEVFYVESWMANRKDSVTLKKQKAELAQYEAALATKQVEFQRTADMFGIDWRNDAARNKARRQEIIAAINKQLDKKIAEAEAKEAAMARGETADAGGD